MAGAGIPGEYKGSQVREVMIKMVFCADMGFFGKKIKKVDSVLRIGYSLRIRKNPVARGSLRIDY